MIRFYTRFFGLAGLLIAGQASALDDNCTPDPVLSTPDVDEPGGRTSYVTPTNPDGISLFRLNVVGPSCYGNPGDPGHDERCCPDSATLDPAGYAACKALQDDNVDAYLQQLRAKTPLLPPYRDHDIVVGSGWYYSDARPHSAVDYRRASVSPGADPTFALYAPADGEVIYSGWEGTAGNVIAIRHQAPDGTEYITSYRHVRNGFTHDRQHACSCATNSPPPADRLAGCSSAQKQTSICKYVGNASYDRFWGTESQTLPAVGTVLERGQFFGWAGNTGTVTLNTDGSPMDPVAANSHLHFMLHVERPTGNDGNDFMHVDPLGVYSKAANQCYALEHDISYRRMIAPFLPEFWDVPYEVIMNDDHLLYYPDAGWKPQTLNFYLDAQGHVKATGAFDPSVSSSYKIWPYETKSSMDQRVLDYPTRRVRQLSVMPAGSTARYSAIWEAEDAGESSTAAFALSDQQYATLEANLEAGTTRGLIDHFVYQIGATRYHAVSHGESAAGAEAESELTYDDFYEMNDDQELLGRVPYSVTATAGVTGGAVKYHAIWRSLPGEWWVNLEMSSSTFESMKAWMTALGYRLHRSQGYDNGTKFLAIWTR